MGSAGDWVKGHIKDIGLGAANPLLLQGKLGLDFLKGKKPATPDVGTPPPVPDITDQAIKAKLREEEFRTGVGSRRNSFITGPMGEKTSLPTLGKSIITGG